MVFGISRIQPIPQFMLSSHASGLFNLAGLVLDIAGALILFRYTPHPTRKPQSHPSIISASSTWLFYGKPLEARQIRMNAWGIRLIVLGFSLQLASAIADMFLV
jgi:hypothetical protein